ncbi:MAG: YwqG family protein, partial [Bacteroidota bacterium]
MIPDFLKKYEAALKDYERECVRVTATPITDSSLKDELSLTTSKFLGLPFFPKTKDYPVDSEGTPMVLAAQINFEEVPVLEGFPKDGMLQLFLSGDNWYDEEYKVYYHSKNELDQDHLKELYFLTDDLYEDFPIYMVHQLSFEKDIDRGGTEDDQFDFKFGDKGFWEFEEELKEN